MLALPSTAPVLLNCRGPQSGATWATATSVPGRSPTRSASASSASARRRRASRQVVATEPGCLGQASRPCATRGAHRYFDALHSIVQSTVEGDLHALKLAVLSLRASTGYGEPACSSGPSVGRDRSARGGPTRSTSGTYGQGKGAGQRPSCAHRRRSRRCRNSYGTGSASTCRPSRTAGQGRPAEAPLSRAGRRRSHGRAAARR